MKKQSNHPTRLLRLCKRILIVVTIRFPRLGNIGGGCIVFHKVEEHIHDKGDER